jgi:AraC-like DNA-binding protein
MEKAKALDYFKTKRYNKEKGSDVMKRFLSEDICVTRVRLACSVGAAEGAPIHKDRPAYGVVYYTHGADRYLFSTGEVLDVGAGDVLFLPRGASYAVEEISPSLCYAINFDISEQTTHAPFSLSVKNGTDVGGAFATAERAWRHKDAGYQAACRAQLYHILSQLQAEHQAAYLGKEKHALIAPAVERIHADYTGDGVSVAALAALCGITPEYFRAIFRGIYHTSPLKYINDLRLMRAAELIASGEYSVSEAARRSGFADPAHFSRAFKTRFGVPPVAYKK